MKFKISTAEDIKTVMGWITDKKACTAWAGPKVVFPLEFEQLCKAIEFDSIPTYSLLDDSELLALGQLKQFETEKRAHLARIVVNPFVRGKGIGRNFCKVLIDEAVNLECQIVTLNVDKDNDTAIGLYHQLGFEIPLPQPNSIREGIYYMVLNL